MKTLYRNIQSVLFFYLCNPAPKLSPSFLQYIFNEVYLNDGEEQLSAPAKEQIDQEKNLLLAFKPVMQKFLHDHVELQVSALYALQVHCNAHVFPKGTQPKGSSIQK